VLTVGVRRNLAVVGPLLSPRKLRLLCCALYRRDWCRSAAFASVIDLAERFADGDASAHELAAVRYARRNLGFPPAWAVCWAPDDDALQMATRALTVLEGDRGNVGEDESRTALLDDVAGHLWRPSAVHPAWLAWNGGTVPHLARLVYDERRFDLLGVLADAIEDAGCTDAGLVEHLRAAGPHVRGCWALDLILQQE
jgi:hypothetical protein